MNKPMQKITAHMKREPYMKKKYPELYIEVMKHPGSSFIEKLYNYCNGDPKHICWCGQQTKFLNFNKGYAKYCSPGCTSKDPQVKEKKIQTVLSHYGVENPSQSTDIRDKVKQTMIERYGNEHYNNRESAAETCMRRYNAPNVMQTDKAKQKLKDTCLERYGVEYVLSLPEVIDKANMSLQERYGGRGNKSSIIQQKAKETCIEKYNDPHYNNRKKAKETCIEKYNDPHYNNRNQAIETSLKRYGTEFASQSGIVKDKIKNTNLNKYNVSCVFQSDKVKSKIKKTCLERYGTEFASQSSIVKDKMKNTNLTRYGVEYVTQSAEVKGKIRERLNNKLKDQIENLIECYYMDGEKYYKIGCGSCSKCDRDHFDIRAIDESRRKSYGLEICPIANPFNPISNTSIEKFVKNILDKHNIQYVCNDRSILNGKELDIYIPDHHIAIECNGVYWHSAKHHDRNYHNDKYTNCLSKGIQLITIWEDQTKSCPKKIEAMLLSKLHIYDTKIYARKCSIKEISASISNEFLNTVHLQNSTNSSYRLGLYHDNELVSVMTFGKSRNCMSGGDEWELYRYAVKPNTVIVGGASRLLSKFIKEKHPNAIISFSSNDISDGSLYKMLGFDFVSSTVGYWYIKDNIRYHRYTFSKHKLVNMGYDKDKSEFEIMDDLGYTRIYDSGQSKWMLSVDY